MAFRTVFIARIGAVPQGLIASLLVALALGGCSGSSGGSGGLLDINNLGSGSTTTQKASTLQLTGPTTVAPGVTTTGYTASYTPGASGALNPGVQIQLQTAGNANNAGNVVVVSPCGAGGVEQPASGGGTTDKDGRVCFSYTAPSSITTPTTITLFATVPGQKDAAGNPLMQTLAVTVQPGTFQFVPPDSTTIGLDPNNPTALRFQRTQASSTGTGTQGVAGQIQLSATGGGQFTLDGTPAGNPVIVSTGGSTGDFTRAVGIYSNSAGAVNVSAIDQSNGRTATLNLQAMDTPTAASAAANPAQVAPGGTSTVTVTVSGGSGALSGAKVSFTLTPANSGSAESLSSFSGTTNNAGQATTQYTSGTQNGSATVQACVTDTSVCGSATITTFSRSG